MVDLVYDEYQVINSVKLTIVIMMLILTLFNAKSVLAVANPPLPKEICAEVGIDDCTKLTEASTNAQYIDLNQDGTKELIIVYGGGSCGSGYWVFKLNEKLKWVTIGAWCGCDDGIFKVKNTRFLALVNITDVLKLPLSWA